MFSVTTPTGTKQVQLLTFAALDGWEIQKKFIDFAASTDAAFRREFTLEILAYAKIMSGEVEIPLTTGALIDNHLQSWQNVKAVFEAVLEHNGIDPKTHADRPEYWANVGSEIAIAFIAEAAKLMGPALYSLNEASKG